MTGVVVGVSPGLGRSAGRYIPQAFGADSLLEGTGFELPVPRAMQGRPKAIIDGFGCMPPSLDYLRLPLVEISEGGPRRNLGTEALSREEPEVRIHSPPADSPSLTGSSAPGSRTPAFRAGVQAVGGGAVHRDRDRPATWRRPAALSLPGQIPVPQCQ